MRGRIDIDWSECPDVERVTCTGTRHGSIRVHLKVKPAGAAISATNVESR